MALVADQDAGDRGVFVPFLCREASTFRGPARLALSQDVPLFFGAAVRDGDSYRGILEPVEAPESGPEGEAETVLLDYRTHQRRLRRPLSCARGGSLPPYTVRATVSTPSSFEKLIAMLDVPVTDDEGFSRIPPTMPNVGINVGPMLGAFGILAGVIKARTRDDFMRINRDGVSAILDAIERCNPPPIDRSPTGRKSTLIYNLEATHSRGDVFLR